jgi:hypothetical protein
MRSRRLQTIPCFFQRKRSAFGSAMEAELAHASRVAGGFAGATSVDDRDMVIPVPTDEAAAARRRGATQA